MEEISQAVGSLPGQRIAVYKDPKRLQLGIGIYDQALGGKTALVIGVEKPEAYHLLNDLLEAYEELYGEPLKRREPRDDLT